MPQLFNDIEVTLLNDFKDFLHLLLGGLDSGLFWCLRPGRQIGMIMLG